MFEEVICRSCDGNGCINCDGHGIRYIEIDDHTLVLHDEISELKEALETSKNEFNILLEASNDFAKSKDEVRLWNENELLKKQLEIAKEALKSGLIMMAEIHSQKQMWPGEVDGFEERARKALKEIESAGE